MAAIQGLGRSGPGWVGTSPAAELEGGGQYQRGWTNSYARGDTFHQNSTYVYEGSDGGEVSFTYMHRELTWDPGTLQEPTAGTVTAIATFPNGSQDTFRDGSWQNGGAVAAASSWESDADGNQWQEGADGTSTKMTNYDGSGIGQQSQIGQGVPTATSL
ncbi:MAG: hypothetical protein ACJARS_003899 [bacterium]|jgi:hypothetical protein